VIYTVSHKLIRDPKRVLCEASLPAINGNCEYNYGPGINDMAIRFLT